MKTQKLEFKIPITYILLLAAFMLIVNLVVDIKTQDYNEIYRFIYSLGFFVTNPFVSITLGFLLILPLPLLIWGIFKKRKDLIIGFSISITISVALLILAAVTN